MMESHIEIKFPDGSQKFAALTEDQVTLGSSPAAGVPLVNSLELLPEHLLLAPRKEGCWISVAKTASVPALVNGRPVSGQLVRWESPVALGDLMIVLHRGSPPQLTLSGTAAETAEDKESGNRVRRWTLVAVFVVAALGAVSLALQTTTNRHVGPPAAAPELFSPGAPCPEGDPVYHAEALANEGAARMDRYPFDPRDGILAVEAYDRAASCYADLGETEASAAFQTLRDRIMQRINDDYRVYQLRLERSLETERNYDALLAIEKLSRLVRHRESSQYTQWVLLLEQRLEAAIEDGRRGRSKKKGN